MARSPTGTIVERAGKDGAVRYAIRFRVPGLGRQYQTLDAATYAEADEELQYVLGQVKRGEWQPPAPAPIVEEAKAEPTLHAFASDWFERNRLSVEERTAE